MHNEIKLPNSPYIDTQLGLKYLNGNRKLYSKVLNSFFTRYKDLEISTLTENELKNTMHTIKGLSATLGMKELSTLAETLNESITEELLLKFSKTLKLIMYDLR
ncbi:MAG: SENSORY TRANSDUCTION HISTIDINE KINASE [uncultured Sulfurovum sp.]|uniref:SENSORY TRANSDUCTION HISTIDINE KINASE n=1 Tax=uncultured Sulfurovum sp. TaxID=269237 RepID=A0A6S6U040_9BACT|nr:MAG: SENSORY TRANSDUCTION HISTIDINE KINASE [uncultured Sulfurovum sp.]